MIRDHDRVNRTALSGCIDETSRRRMGAPASIPEAVLANLARACDAYFSVSSHAKPHEGGDMGDVRDLTAASYPGLDIMAASVHPSCLRSMRGLMGVFCSRLAVAKGRQGRGGREDAYKTEETEVHRACMPTFQPLSQISPDGMSAFVTECAHPSHEIPHGTSFMPQMDYACHRPVSVSVW